MHSTQEGSKSSRHEGLPDNSPLKTLPEADKRLISAFHGIGMCEYSMGGATPVSWSEINHYSLASGCNLDCWEKETIRLMSEQYCGWMHKGKDVSVQAPYNPIQESEEALEVQRGIVSNKWEAIKAARKAAEAQKDNHSKGNYKLSNKKPPML